MNTREDKQKTIADALSTFEGRKKLLVNMCFPLDQYKIFGETEEQRIDRLYAKLCIEAERREQEEDDED